VIVRELDVTSANGSLSSIHSREEQPTLPPLVIGVAGGTGAGKTTLVDRICSKYSHSSVAVLDQDSYYKDQSHLGKEERNALNFDDPCALDHDLLFLHVQQLQAGTGIEKPVYCFAAHCRTGEAKLIAPASLIVIEGILALYDARLRSLMDLTIFVHAEADVRFIRRLRRDVAKRGRTVESVIVQYQKSVRPMHNLHVEPTKRFADLIVDATNSVAPAMIAIENAIAAAWTKRLPSGTMTSR